MMRNFFIILLLCLTSAAWCADRTEADAYMAGVPALITANDYATIEDLCKRSLHADDSCPLAHFYMALCLEKSGKVRDAFKEYQSAGNLATKEKDSALATKAAAASKRLGSGLMEINSLDSKLAEKLQKIGSEALEAGRMDTAKQAYSTLLSLEPDNEKAKAALEKAKAAMKERSDPVKTRIAAAMLAETWYKIGTGKKEEAVELATALAQKFADTEWGKEAAGLIERDFAAPKKEDMDILAQKLKEQAAAKPVEPSKTSVAVSSKPAPKGGVDIESLEKATDASTQKLPKAELIAAFADAYKNGKSFYAKATPGAEGNQENLIKALEQFVKAESVFARLETENIHDDSASENVKDAAMLRYACMKMQILAH